VARTSHIAKSKKKPKFEVRQHKPLSSVRPPACLLRSSSFAACDFRSLALQGEIPGVKKSSGNLGWREISVREDKRKAVNTTDTIADLATRVRNASRSHHPKWRDAGLRD